jgi:multidrug efflux pump subunit AcrB
VKKLIDFFIERSLLVNMISVMIVVAGGFSVWTLQKETFPKIEFDVIIVNAFYPGSSAEDVEKLVTIPIERKIKGIDGIKEINAISAENRSIIYMEIDPDAKLEEVSDDIKTQIDLVDDLPEDVDPPTVTTANNKRRGILKLALTHRKNDYDFLRNTSKKIRDELEQHFEIAQVILDGYRVDQIRVELIPDKLNDYEVTVSEVYNAIRERNLNLSAGVIEDPAGDIIVRTVSEFEGLEDIEELVVRSNNSGFKVKVKDIAHVMRGPAKGSVLQRSNGVPAIFLDIKGKESADILQTTKKVKNTIEDFFRVEKYQDFNFRYVDDTSYYVKRRLNILKNNGLMGIILVFICLMAFLNFKTSVVTSLGAPIAFMVSFFVMESMGLSINLISMFALILVLGMLVDDSIIVAEYYYQKLEKGLSPKEAAKQASYETVKPVTATVLTTMIAFGSLFYMGGIMGKFLWPVPAVVIICLFASLFECFFILPSHLSDFCRLKISEKDNHWYTKLKNVYGAVLKKFLKAPWAILVFFFALLLGSLFTATKMDFELFPGDDVRTVFLQIKGKVGTPLSITDQGVAKLEKVVLNNTSKEELEQIKSQVGLLLGDRGNKRGTHYGSLVLYLTPPGERERSTDEIIDELTSKGRKQIGDFVLTVVKRQGGPPKGKAVDIQLKGDSLDELKAASKEVNMALKKEPGIMATEVDFEEGKEQLVLSVNDAEARRLGLNTSKIALEVRRLLSEDSVTEIRESDEDIEIVISLVQESRRKIESIEQLFILNSQGRRIPFSKVVKVTKRPGAFIIRRLDRKRIISVTASINKKKTTPVKVAKTFKPKVLKIIEKYPSLSVEFAGENKDTNKSMKGLMKSGMISIFLIFVVLVVMFNSILHPMVVMAAIPLGLIGVVWTFLIAGQALGFMAFMGVVALVGVVVNDSIVLVTFINQKRKEGLELKEAVYEASLGRFRAVILTTFTTVAGLLPIAHPIITRVFSFGSDVDSDPFLQPMALSFAWGLLVASLVTLVFIPCNYLFFEQVKAFSSKLLRRIIHSRRDQEA